MKTILFELLTLCFCVGVFCLTEETAIAKVYATRILNRGEFRQHCEKHKTQKQVLDNLE